MDMMTWSIQTNPPGSAPAVIAEYLLNDLGLFVKRERRMPKSAPLTALTGFRVGYAAIPGTDYRAAPMDRCAILWHKVASVAAGGAGELMIKGNRNDEIVLVYPPAYGDAVVRYIGDMRRLHPPVAGPDRAAAAWICWRDDDEWDDPFAPLSDMIREEMGTERFIEPEVLEETVLAVVPEPAPAPPGATAGRPKFCAACGAALPPDCHFCGHCGARIPS